MTTESAREISGRFAPAAARVFTEICASRYFTQLKIKLDLYKLYPDGEFVSLGMLVY